MRTREKCHTLATLGGTHQLLYFYFGKNDSVILLFKIISQWVSPSGGYRNMVKTANGHERE
jgi:hypothetical protein